MWFFFQEIQGQIWNWMHCISQGLGIFYCFAVEKAVEAGFHSHMIDQVFACRSSNLCSIPGQDRLNEIFSLNNMLFL